MLLLYVYDYHCDLHLLFFYSQSVSKHEISKTFANDDVVLIE